MTNAATELGARAQIDFKCFVDNCAGVVKFNLADISRRDFQAVCPICHRAYVLEPNLRDKLKRMLELGYENYGLTGNFNFSLNMPTEYPNALVECLFMSSLPDEEMLADPATHKKIAEKVVAGLEDYLQQVAESKGIKTNKKKKYCSR